MLRERNGACLESARDESRIGGRRPKLMPQQQTEVLKMASPVAEHECSRKRPWWLESKQTNPRRHEDVARLA